MRIRRGVLGAALITPLLLGGVAQAGERVVEVEMIGNRFEPEMLEVTVGTKVRWVNAERRSNHDVTFPEEEITSGRLFPGETWERTFDEAGTYPYHCQPHENRGMQGVIRVVAAGDD